NGLVTIDVQDNGFALDGAAGFDRLVDGGDCGDMYTYSPPSGDHPNDRPFRSHTTVVERDPLRGRIALRRHFDWGETTSTYELRAPRVRARRERHAARNHAPPEHRHAVPPGAPRPALSGGTAVAGTERAAPGPAHLPLRRCDRLEH